MSQPWNVKPKGCPAVGPPSELASSQPSLGATEVNRPGNSATTASARMSSAEIMNNGRRRSLRQASDHRLRGAWSVLTASVANSGVSSMGATKWPLLLVIADPRVKPGIQEINKQVGHHEHQHQHADDGNDGGSFAAEDCLVELVADARNVEDAFRHDGAAHQAAQVGTEVG